MDNLLRVLTSPVFQTPAPSRIPRESFAETDSPIFTALTKASTATKPKTLLVDWQQPDRYLPYLPVQSVDETGVYEMIFQSSDPRPDVTVYLGQGILKQRIDAYGRNGDAGSSYAGKTKRIINDFMRTALYHRYSVYYRAWVVDKPRAFLWETMLLHVWDYPLNMSPGENRQARVPVPEWDNKILTPVLSEEEKHPPLQRTRISIPCVYGSCACEASSVPLDRFFLEIDLKEQLIPSEMKVALAKMASIEQSLHCRPGTLDRFSLCSAHQCPSLPHGNSMLRKSRSLPTSTPSRIAPITPIRRSESAGVSTSISTATHSHVSNNTRVAHGIAAEVDASPVPSQPSTHPPLVAEPGAVPAFTESLPRSTLSNSDALKPTQLQRTASASHPYKTVVVISPPPSPSWSPANHEETTTSRDPKGVDAKQDLASTLRSKSINTPIVHPRSHRDEKHFEKRIPVLTQVLLALDSPTSPSCSPLTTAPVRRSTSLIGRGSATSANPTFIENSASNAQHSVGTMKKAQETLKAPVLHVSDDEEKGGKQNDKKVVPRQRLVPKKSDKQAATTEDQENQASSARRLRKRWSQDQVNILLEAVSVYGVGHWDEIARSEYGNALVRRTSRDIKDKWRNLRKTQTEENLLAPFRPAGETMNA